MAKQVIEPEIVAQSQVAPRQENRHSGQANFRFYRANSSGCLGLILFVFISVFVFLPALILSLFKKRK